MSRTPFRTDSMAAIFVTVIAVDYRDRISRPRTWHYHPELRWRYQISRILADERNSDEYVTGFAGGRRHILDLGLLYGNARTAEARRRQPVLQRSAEHPRPRGRYRADSGQAPAELAVRCGV